MAKKQWEYKVVPHTDVMYDSGLETVLNEHGKNDWELVQCIVIGHIHWIFKKEK